MKITITFDENATPDKQAGAIFDALMDGVAARTRAQFYAMLLEHADGFCGAMKRKGKTRTYAPITGGGRRR